jgi:hypothetical protein
MTEPDSIGTAKLQLRDVIAEFQPPLCNALTISPWVAMSLMQKAIRRGRKELALRAAATLLKHHRNAFGAGLAALPSKMVASATWVQSPWLLQQRRGNDFVKVWAGNGQQRVSL